MNGFIARGRAGNTDFLIKDDEFDCDVHGDRVMRVYKIGVSPSRDIESLSLQALGTGQLLTPFAGPSRLTRPRPAAS